MGTSGVESRTEGNRTRSKELVICRLQVCLLVYLIVLADYQLELVGRLLALRLERTRRIFSQQVFRSRKMPKKLFSALEHFS